MCRNGALVRTQVSIEARNYDLLTRKCQANFQIAESMQYFQTFFCNAMIQSHL